MKKTDMPKALEIESAVLGSILLNNNCISESILIINSSTFFLEENRIIFSAMLQMYDAGIPIDTATLYNELKKTGKDGLIPEAALYISQLQNISSSANIVYHCKILKEKQILRDMLNLSEEIVQRVSKGTDDAFDIRADAADKLESILEDVQSGADDKSLWEDFRETISKIEQAASEEGETGFITKSFPSFNRVTGGINNCDFIVIYGLEKQGKTTMALQILMDFAIDQKVPVAMFSLEMHKDTVYKKCYSLRTQIEYQKLRSPKQSKLEPAEFTAFLSDAYREFEDSQIYIIDKPLDKYKIKAKMKWLKQNKGVKVFAIDYIGLIPTYEKFERRDLAIADLSRFFKLAAKELNVPVIILSQSNAEGKVAESKALSRDCDFIFSIKKPIECQMTSIPISKDGRKYSVKTSEDHFLVTLEHSRHGRNLYQFLCGYTSANLFKELDPFHESVESRQEFDVI